MTDEEARRMLARMEALAAEVESLRREVAEARRAAEDAAAEKEDSSDFGGGGEPDWSGAMGRVPDGFIENPAIPPLPDTTAAKDPNALQYKSIDDRKDSPPPGVTQIHDFDEAPLSNTRRIQLKAVTTTGTGGGRKLQLVDPDGNADFRTKWMIPLREAGTGGREIKWACIGGEVGLPNGGGGCAPVVSPAAQSADGRTLAGTVTGRAWNDQTGQCEDGQTISIYNGKDGAAGANGCTFTPHISSEGVLSWTNDCSAANPDPIKLTVGLRENLSFVTSLDYMRVETDPGTNVTSLKLGYSNATWRAAQNDWDFGTAEVALPIKVC